MPHSDEPHRMPADTYARHLAELAWPSQRPRSLIATIPLTGCVRRSACSMNPCAKAYGGLKTIARTELLGGESQGALDRLAKFC